MASTVTRSQSNRAPLGCGGTRDSHHGRADDKSAATAWCYHDNMTNISEECLQHLVESMTRRIKAVLKEKGVQPVTSKVYLIKWLVSVCVYICMCVYIYIYIHTHWRMIINYVRFISNYLVNKYIVCQFVYEETNACCFSNYRNQFISLTIHIATLFYFLFFLCFVNLYII